MTNSERGSGRTTAQLLQLSESLYNGPCLNVFYVVHHMSFARYCMMLFQGHTAYDALFEPAVNRLYFRNKADKLVTISFTTPDQVEQRTRGLRDPVMYDHFVAEKENRKKSAINFETNPWTDIHTPN